jgi:hypothetical protein
VTLGNALRRTILSSIIGWDNGSQDRGYAPRVPGDGRGVGRQYRDDTQHPPRQGQYTGRSNRHILRLSVSGERVVTADFQSNPEIDIFKSSRLSAR